MSNATIINRLEELSAAWRAQFDNPPELPLNWSLDEGLFLMLNGEFVAAVKAIDLEGLSFDVESLRLDMTNGSYVVIEIDWPYEGKARISEIVSHKVIAPKDGE